MTPFFFGDSDRRLFGVYEPPERLRPGAPRAIVICAPWGPEYVVAHAALRRLAASLAGAGWHVLRFDYFGAGDSGGESEDGDLEGWADDVDMAVDELKHMSGASRAALLGLRLGASLAAKVSARRNDIDVLTLWDPIVSGQAYLDELTREHQAWVSERTRYTPLPPTDAPNRICFPLPPNVEQQMALVELAAVAPKLRQKILLIRTGASEGEDAVAAALPAAARNRLTVENVGDTPPWRLNASGFGGPMPVEAFKTIGAWLS